MSKQLWANNAKSTLAAGITNVATACSVQAGDGAKFPNPSGGDWFLATLVDNSGNIEIVKVTARTADAFTTIARAQEGTVAQAFAGGSKCENRSTSGTLGRMVQTAGLTSTRIPFADASGNLVDSANLVFSGTALTVNQLTASTSFHCNGSIEGDSTLYIHSHGGFGVSAPSAWSVGKAVEVGFPGTGIWGDSVGVTDFMSNVYYNSGYKFAGTGYATIYEHDSGAHKWFTSSASGTAGNAATMLAKMSLSATGTLLVNGLSVADYVTTADGTQGYWAGAYVNRATTEPSNSVNLVNGAAPVGAAVNTCTLYVTAGEMRVMDAAGNATLLSPHDGDKNWIHHCVKGDGNEILIRMEQMAGMLNEMFGKDFLVKFGVPFIEDGKVEYEKIDTGYLGADFKPLYVVRKTQTRGARP